jgi:hypothetical protein
MFSEEAKLMWEEYCYHNALCDMTTLMLKYGSKKVINDLIDMYNSAEAINNG